MELGRTAYVVLGMLRLGRRTGYEIKSLVDVSTRFFWAASYGQIYPELKRLEDAGLVRREGGSDNGRDRKAYALTAEGERALDEWLTSDEPLLVELRHEGALRLFFSDALPPDEQRAQLRRIRAAHEDTGAQLRAIRARKGDGDHRLPALTLEWGIELQDFMVDWCQKAERRLAREATKG